MYGEGLRLYVFDNSVCESSSNCIILHYTQELWTEMKGSEVSASG